MTSKARPCPMTDCSNMIAAASEFDQCSVCRANNRAWKRKRPAQWFKYRRKLNKFSARMDLLISESNVTMLKKRKA